MIDLQKVLHIPYINFFLTYVVFSCFFPLVSLAADNASCASDKCHTGLLAPEATHPTDKGCDFCHAANTPIHPNPETIEFSTIKSGCIECHPEIVDYTKLHSPVASGGCTICHDAHGSKVTFYLKKTEGPICYLCHDPVSTPSDIEMHSGVKTDECKICHNPHGSFYDKLLVAQFPPEYFVDYTDDNVYQLCFTCHKIDLLLHPKTSYNTNFRDQRKNLHYLHVKKDSRGKSCKFCHNIHASRQIKLMAEKVTFGDWEMPINFVQTENGGRCSPGCHKPEEYSRDIK